MRNADNAAALRDQLIDNGFDAYIQRGTTLYRVFAGPVSSRAEASRLRQRLADEQRLDGFVVQLRPASD